ncbi:MAG: hypothetical protein CMA00_000935 [Methanobacteriota archaeon]|nr:MAG: hypothetical protein CMA00_000935 [Euryarchaeota archaeon]
MPNSTLAEVRGVTIQRGNNQVLRDASISIRRGEIVAVTGENGSGKSTLIEAFAGILPLRQGEVKWFSESGEVVVRDFEGRRNPPPAMGLTLQRDGICGDETVSERLSVALSVAGVDPQPDRINSLLDSWGLSHRSDERISQLSGGLRRRLSILCGLAPAALSDSPRLVLLDEPSEGLDESSKDSLMGWIRALAERKHGIIVATHDGELSSCADRVVKIEDSTLKETSGESSGAAEEIPEACPNISRNTISSLIGWSFRIEARNPIDLVGRATPAIVAILLSYALVGEIDLESHDSSLLAALVLAPAFIVSVASPAIVSRLREEDSGRWWDAIVGPMARPAYSISGASIFLPIPITYISWFVLSGSVDSEISSEVLKWLWIPSLALLDLAIAATALHLLVSDLSRSNAAPAPLLLVVLVWPFLELTDALSSIIDQGMTFGLAINDPIPTCLIASLISALVWLAAILIPDY